MSNEMHQAIDERDSMEKTLSMLNQDHCKLIEEHQKREEFVNKVDNTNKQLASENKELKERVKKMEAIIYGKIKSTVK